VATWGIIGFAVLVFADFIFSLVDAWQQMKNPRRHGLIEPVHPTLPWRPITSTLITNTYNQGEQVSQSEGT
jgi:hypothetical protein